MVCLPIIMAQDYNSFHGLMRDHIPQAYDKWLKLHAMWHHHYAAERHDIRNVHVSPDRFARHVTEKGCAPDVTELFAFAQLTANGNRN